MLSRRNFLGFGLAATGGIFVPKFGAWYRQGSGSPVNLSKLTQSWVLAGRPYATYYNFHTHTLYMRQGGVWQVVPLANRLV